MSVQAFIEGNLGELLRAEAKALEKGCDRALRRASGGIRGQIRRNIARAGFAGGGKQLARTVRVSSIRGEGVERNLVVYSKAVYPVAPMRPGGAIDLVQLFAQGATIRAAGGGWLAIPTDYAPVAGGRGVRRRMSPKEMIAAGVKLAFLPAGPGRLVAVRRERGRSIVTHVLVRQVSLRKRYDIQGAVDRWVARLPEIFAREINREVEKSAVLNRYAA